MKKTFASMRFYNYRVWFFAALVANVGTWMQRVAQDWLVLTELTNNSGTAVGITTALQFLPALFLSPYGGLLADRLNKRKLLLTTQASMGCLAIGLGVLTLGGWVQLWHVYVFALLLGCVAAIDAPVRQVFVAELVPSEKLPNAIGLNSASFNAARLVGPAVAGLAIAGVGTGWVFIINGASFAATLIAMLCLRKSELHVRESIPRKKGQLREGIKYVGRRTDIVVIMIVVGVVSAFGLNFQLTSGLMATTVFHKGAGEYGMLGSILAIGSLTGALLAARRKHPRVRLVVGAALGFGVSAGVMCLMPTYETFAIMAIPVGFMSLTMMTAANSTIQMNTDPMMRGRVMSLYMMVFQGATPIGSPIIGWIGEHWGARWSIGVGAISSTVIAVLAGIWAWKTWHVRAQIRVRQRPHVLVINPVAVDLDQAKGSAAAPEAKSATEDTTPAASIEASTTKDRQRKPKDETPAAGADSQGKAASESQGSETIGGCR